MTSPGLKRPIDFELPQQSANNSTSSSSSGSIQNNNVSLSNGNKRRCTTNFTSTSPPAQQIKVDQYSGISNQQIMTQQQVTNSSSPFRELPAIHDTIQEDVSNLIKDELHRTSHESHHLNGNEPSILSARQTQSICERLVKDREQKMRDEYDKILAHKLAEQYDLLTKANYLNSYVGSTARHIPPTTAASVAPIHHLQARNHHHQQQQQHHHRHQAAALAAANQQSLLAAAFSSMQRSAAANTVPSPPDTTQSLPDLTTLAATLSANGHPSAITSQLAFNLQQQAAAAAAIQAQAQQQRPPSTSSTIPSGPVLLTSNLDEQLATPEALFTLFGVFGDVVRVKILFNKKDNALIQMADANQAQVAQSYLDKHKVFGKVIRVTRSKHQSVQMPREGNQSDAGLTKDFTNSPLHRFKFPGSRNYLNIYPPSNTLHISNIPATIDDSALQQAFKEQCGFDCLSFKFFPKDKKMALMKFDSIEHATIALIKMHNFQISDENNLRVSFSKSIMQQ